MFVVTTARRRGLVVAAPRMAMLVASVPPLVKMISSGDAPIRVATSLRACSIASCARRPNA